MARIVGIDLGSYSVKVVRLEPKGRGAFEVESYGEALVPPPVDGSDALATLPDRLGQALAELRQKGQLDGDVFITGLPGDGAAVRTLQFPFADAKKIGEALPFALESELPLDLEEIVLSWVIVGPSKKRDQNAAMTDVLVAWAKKDAVQALLNLLAVHGIDPRHVQLSALALDDLYTGLLQASEGASSGDGPTELRTPGGTVIEMGEGAPEPAIAIVDIGHRSTSVCVVANGRVISANSILHGGADATRALAKAIGLPLIEAERGKRKEAFIEVAGARAQFPEQAHVSEVLKSAYAPVVRRLRQIFQASISQARVRVVKAIIVGGGSRVLNLDRHMAEELNVKVARGRELAHALREQLPLEASEEGAPEAALAFAYALSGMQTQKSRSRIDFRTAEFAWKGDFDFLREKAPQLLVWAATLVLLLGVSGAARAFVLSRTEDALVKQELSECKEITGKADIDSYSRCLAMIQERIKGQATFSVPERSSADTYLELAQRLPAETEVHRKIVELDITNERVKMRGLTSSYEAIDKIVERLQGGKCFALVEKGKAQNKGSDVEFNISINLDCNAAPGDGKAPAPLPPGGAHPIATTPTQPLTPAATAVPSVAPPSQPGIIPHNIVPAGDDGTEPTVGDAKPKSGKLTPDEIEERRERLKKMREEREAKRAGVKLNGDAPTPMSPIVQPRNPGFRPALHQNLPVKLTPEVPKKEVE
ncbi:MAG TPA: pilus assembly protein PilM [Myxococcota bacterium]|jgi:general secretion pathway protein L